MVSVEFTSHLFEQNNSLIQSRFAHDGTLTWSVCSNIHLFSVVWFVQLFSAKMFCSLS